MTSIDPHYQKKDEVSPYARIDLGGQNNQLDYKSDEDLSLITSFVSRILSRVFLDIFMQNSFSSFSWKALKPSNPRFLPISCAVTRNQSAPLLLLPSSSTRVRNTGRRLLISHNLSTG